MTSTVALYARVSTDEQALSLDGQLRELRDQAHAMGLEVVAEVLDKGEKRRDIERPGIEEIMGLAEAGKIGTVLAWAWDRFGEFPVPEMLALDLEGFGVSLRSLDDGGGGEDSYELRAIKSLFSRREGRDRVRRSTRGRTDKALRGELFGGFRSRFGFAFVTAPNGKGREVNVGCRVDPDQMATVRRVFEMVADGASLHLVSRTFEEEGLPNPSGGPRWSRTTLRHIVLDDVFRPHDFEEVRALVPPNVAAGLDPARSYGISWSGRKRSRFASSRGKKRVVYETDRSEWTAVPVDLTGSGLDRATVDRARERVASNRAPSKAGDRFWELSGGVLRCGECGRSMHAYRRAKKGGGHNHYYRCRPEHALDRCPNDKSHPVEQLEHDAASLFEEYASAGTLLRLFEESLERQIGRGTLEAAARRRAALTERLGKLAGMRRSFQDQAAEGLMTFPELKDRLADLDEEKAAISGELRAAEDEAEAARRIGTARDYLLSATLLSPTWFEEPESVGPDRWPTWGASPEELRAAYARLGCRFEVDQGGELTLKLELDLGGEKPLHSASTT